MKVCDMQRWRLEHVLTMVNSEERLLLNLWRIRMRYNFLSVVILLFTSGCFYCNVPRYPYHTITHQRTSRYFIIDRLISDSLQPSSL